MQRTIVTATITVRDPETGKDAIVPRRWYQQGPGRRSVLSMNQVRRTQPTRPLDPAIVAHNKKVQDERTKKLVARFLRETDPAKLAHMGKRLYKRGVRLQPAQDRAAA